MWKMTLKMCIFKLSSQSGKPPNTSRVSIFWRSYFRAKQEQADWNIPQLVERYLFREGVPWALVGRAQGQPLRLPSGPCPDGGHSRCSGRDTSKGQTQREPFCPLSDRQTEASRKKASVVNLYVNDSQSYWRYRKRHFFLPTPDSV